MTSNSPKIQHHLLLVLGLRTSRQGCILHCSRSNLAILDATVLRIMNPQFASRCRLFNFQIGKKNMCQSNFWGVQICSNSFPNIWAILAGHWRVKRSMSAVLQDLRQAKASDCWGEQSQDGVHDGLCFWRWFDGHNNIVYIYIYVENKIYIYMCNIYIHICV